MMLLLQFLSQLVPFSAYPYVDRKVVKEYVGQSYHETMTERSLSDDLGEKRRLQLVLGRAGAGGSRVISALSRLGSN